MGTAWGAAFSEAARARIKARIVGTSASTAGRIVNSGSAIGGYACLGRLYLAVLCFGALYFCALRTFGLGLASTAAVKPKASASASAMVRIFISFMLSLAARNHNLPIG